jgi:hypothetical protein
MDVLRATASAEVPQQLQERLLYDVFGVLLVPQQSDSEAVDGSAMLPEQLLRGVRGIRRRVHRLPLV